MMMRDPPIDGQTPLDDLSGLRDRSVRTRAELNAAEARNISLAMVKYLSVRPSARVARFDVAWLLRVHREMFGVVWRWAGVIRRVDLNIGSPALRVETDLHELVLDLRSWDSGGMQILERACRLHHRAVLVHPFLNGNGRWARLVSNIWLRQRGAPLVEWPEDVMGNASVIRDAYLRAMRQADNGDLTPLLEMHRAYVRL